MMSFTIFLIFLFCNLKCISIFYIFSQTMQLASYHYFFNGTVSIGSIEKVPLNFKIKNILTLSFYHIFTLNFYCLFDILQNQKTRKNAIYLAFILFLKSLARFLQDPFKTIAIKIYTKKSCGNTCQSSIFYPVFAI